MLTSPSAVIIGTKTPASKLIWPLAVIVVADSLSLLTNVADILFNYIINIILPFKEAAENPFLTWVEHLLLAALMHILTVLKHHLLTTLLHRLVVTFMNRLPALLL
jgi:hypothetical protein